MRKHKWKDNKCVRCGIKRKMKYWRTLMAIVNHPPWEAYASGTNYYYFFGDDDVTMNGTFKRPDCKNETA